MKISPFCFLLLVAFCSCKNASSSSHEHKNLRQLNWLLGSWENISGESESHENWTQKNDSVYTGRSFTLKKGDTVFLEYLSIEDHDTEMLYIPAVTNQNQGKPVPFRLVSSTDGVFVFENKAHDFPQKIVYSNPVWDSVDAYIEGIENGKYRKVAFPMKRVDK